jgi:hypothetical protein
MTTEEFSEYYDSGGIELKSEINLSHYQQIVNGIKESKLVAIEHKKMIPNIE